MLVLTIIVLTLASIGTIAVLASKWREYKREQRITQFDEYWAAQLDQRYTALGLEPPAVRASSQELVEGWLAVEDYDEQYELVGWAEPGVEWDEL